MINPFCESLKDFFGEMVFYGILKEEDAQCLKTDISIDPYFYMLLVSAVVLAIFNTFVLSAVSQYHQDTGVDTTHIVNQKASTLDDLVSLEDGEDNPVGVKSSILPLRVMYTDRFRWFLYRENEAVVVQDQPNDVMLEGADTMLFSVNSTDEDQPSYQTED
jgi:hypothetical protein